MEKVWDELKKIEAQAEQIRTEAQNTANSIRSMTKQDSEMLIANSRIYAEEESQKVHVNAIQEANSKRDEQLKANMLDAEKLKVQAEKHTEKAISKIVNAIIKGS